MDEKNWLAEQFEGQREKLRSVAYRMLGSAPEADDAVQEAWLKLSRADSGEVENMGGWLTTVVARVCLDMLRSRKSRREEALDAAGPVSARGGEGPGDPEHEVLLADAMGPALLLLLDSLVPTERVTFVLHDLFGMSFEDIAPIVGRSVVAARQLASRARRRIQGATLPEDDVERQREVVSAFLLASREGNFDRLLAVLDPDVVLRADATAIATAEANRGRQGAPALSGVVRGAEAVAKVLAGNARGARAATVDGAAGAAWAPGGQPRAVFAFTIVAGRVAEIEIFAHPDALTRFEVKLD
ncbi:MAG TPA: sigma-70 family RNA polymerase sigma factor [Polyangiaceae bacterium]|nr:sigma-70 family RNA polymerase sigma factor [Polyangiaceae bacterium]